MKTYEAKTRPKKAKTVAIGNQDRGNGSKDGKVLRQPGSVHPVRIQDRTESGSRPGKANPGIQTSWVAQITRQLHEPVVSFAYKHSNIDLTKTYGQLMDIHRLIPSHKYTLEKKTNVQAGLYSAIYALEQEAEKRGLDFCLYLERDEVVPVLTDSYDVYALLYCELDFLDNLQRTDPALFRLLTSIVRILMYQKGIPDWTEYIEYASNCADGLDEDEEFFQGLQESRAYYYTGAPKAFLQTLRKFKSLSLQAIKRFPTRDKYLQAIIRNAVQVIEHPCVFGDFINPIEDSDRHVQIYQFINFGWDFNQPIERYYTDFLNCCSDNAEIDDARRIIRLNNANAWSEKPHARTFFESLARYFVAMQNFKRKYNGTT